MPFVSPISLSTLLLFVFVEGKPKKRDSKHEWEQKPHI